MKQQGTPKQQFRQEMCDLWRGPMTADQIVRAYAIRYRRLFQRVFSQQRLNEIWSLAVKADRLPDAPRPHFIKNIIGDPAPVIPSDCEMKTAEMAALADEIEETERALERSGLRIPDVDPLLASLRAVHGDPHAFLHEMPAHILAAEARGWEPSEDWLRRYVHKRDEDVAAAKRERPDLFGPMRSQPASSRSTLESAT